ncbi:hypothetical protein NN561_020076 [Cricetulus griseus]
MKRHAAPFGCNSAALSRVAATNTVTAGARPSLTHPALLASLRASASGAALTPRPPLTLLRGLQRPARAGAPGRMRRRAPPHGARPPVERTHGPWSSDPRGRDAGTPEATMATMTEDSAPRARCRVTLTSGRLQEEEVQGLLGEFMRPRPLARLPAGGTRSEEREGRGEEGVWKVPRMAVEKCGFRDCLKILSLFLIPKTKFMAFCVSVNRNSPEA